MLHDYPILFVSWRSPKTRSIHPVGRLAFDAATHHYEFRYICSARKAVDDGFAPFSEFPKLDAAYRGKELFPLFSNRVMRESRPGYAAFLKTLGLPDDGAHPMAILARTGGRRQTDQIEMFPMPALDADGCYVAHCLLRSIRYMPQPATEERIAKLESNEQLFPMLDVQNTVDPKAVSVRTADNWLIGYVPAYLTTDLQQLQENCCDFKLFVSRVNPPPAEEHHRLLCKVVSCWPQGFKPFDNPSFQPISVRNAA